MLTIPKKWFSWADFFTTKRVLIDSDLNEILANEQKKKVLFEAINKLEKNNLNSATATTDINGEEFSIEVEVVGTQFLEK